MSSMNLLRAHYAWRNVACLIGLVAGLYVFFQLQSNDLPVQQAFNRDQWQEAIADPDLLEEFNLRPEDGPGVRARMVIDVLENVLHHKMTREDVEAQLGPPDVRAWSRHFPMNGWQIGAGRTEHIEESQALVVTYDNADRLILAEVAGPRASETRAAARWPAGIRATWCSEPGSGP